MVKKTLSIFEEALLDSVLLEFAGVPSEEDIEYSFTTDFERKSEKLIRKSRSRYWHHVNTTAKKLLIAAIITALLVGSAIAISWVSEGSIKLFMNSTGTNYYFTVDEDAIKKAPKDLETIYSPGYIPRGFNVAEVTVSDGHVSHVYESADKHRIEFIQEKMPDDPSDAFDCYPTVADSKVYNVVLNGYDIIEIIYNDGNGNSAIMMVWRSEDYFFSLYCDSPVTLAQARGMLLSIHPNEARTAAYLTEKNSD